MFQALGLKIIYMQQIKLSSEVFYNQRAYVSVYWKNEK